MTCVSQLRDCIWAMPSARATHASHRARILGLGLSVGIAIALGGCRFGQPAAQEPAPVKEAALSCYWYVEDYAARPAVQATMADGILTERECSDVIQPLVESEYADALASRRASAGEAVRKASVIEARRAETHSGSVHENAPGRPNPVNPIRRTPKGGEA